MHLSTPLQLKKCLRITSCDDALLILAILFWFFSKVGCEDGTKVFEGGCKMYAILDFIQGDVRYL